METKRYYIQQALNEIVKLLGFGIEDVKTFLQDELNKRLNFYVGVNKYFVTAEKIRVWLKFMDEETDYSSSAFFDGYFYVLDTPFTDCQLEFLSKDQLIKILIDIQQFTMQEAKRPYDYCDRTACGYHAMSEAVKKKIQTSVKNLAINKEQNNIMQIEKIPDERMGILTNHGICIKINELIDAVNKLCKK